MIFNSQRRENDGVNRLLSSFNVLTTWEETVLLVGILAIFGIFLFILLICLLFCYRRRSKDTFQEPLNAQIDESYQDDGNRVIKFGQTPSWTKEKRSRKKQKRIYGQLHRINEANEEKDTMSMRSRDSQALSAASVPPRINGSAINALLVNDPNREYLQRQIDMDLTERIYAESNPPVFADHSNAAIDRITNSPLLGDYGRRVYTPDQGKNLCITFTKSLPTRQFKIFIFFSGLLRTRDGYSSGHRTPASNYEQDLLHGGPFPLYPQNTTIRHRVPPPRNGSAGSPSGSGSSQNGSTSGRYPTGLSNGPLKLSSIQAMVKQMDQEQNKDVDCK